MPFGTQQTTNLQHTSPSELSKKQRPSGVGGTNQMLQYVMIWIMYFLEIQPKIDYTLPLFVVSKGLFILKGALNCQLWQFIILQKISF